ncbi:TolC family outer membrane protein [Hydrogenophaga sp. 5NK40-0174]|uniref:TolC family outer membrane protein n=1 Tax=Hydrogenophaga sp. 5NK40-0174 TaxID=3127649 RepID=UPI0031055697
MTVKPTATPLRRTHRAFARLLTASVLSLGASSWVQAQGLIELYEAAREYDATYLAARSQYDANLAQADQARAGLLPQAGLSAGIFRSNLDVNGAPNTRDLDSREVTLSASQPLYRPSNYASNEQARLSVDVAQAQLKAAEQELIIRITQAYFDVLAAQDTVAFVTAQKEAVEQQLAAAKRNFEVGTTTVTDSREAQARFDLVQAQEIAAENDLRVKRLALDQLVGRSSVTPKPLTAPVSLPAVTPADVEAWVQTALENNTSVQQASKAVEIARLEIDKAKAGHKPTLDLVGQYEYSDAPSNTSPANVRSKTATVGLQFNLPLFAGFAVQNGVKKALALEAKARADKESAVRAVSQATRSAYLGVLAGMSQVKALEAAEASSQSALDANKLGYQVGVRINIDVLNAQSQLFQTKRDLAAARHNVLIGGLRLRQASGTLSPEDLTPIQNLLTP